MPEPLSMSFGLWGVLSSAVLAASIGAAAAWQFAQQRGRKALIEAQRQRDAAAHATRAAALGGITASITHDVNQSIGAILSNAEAAEILLRACPPRLDEVREILRDIQRDGLRAHEVVRLVRTFLQRREPERIRLDVREPLDAALALAVPNASRAGVAVQVEEPEARHVIGDPVQLQQAFLNVTLNAVEAMRDTERKELVVRVAGAGKVRIAFVDTGGGIDVGTEGRIFDWFYSTRADTLGIGLPVARMLVEQHSGDITAANDPVGGGAIVTITLPSA